MLIASMFEALILHYIQSLSSGFKPTSARTGIAITSVMTFKCNAGSLSELCCVMHIPAELMDVKGTNEGCD
jgi:hypothetical protein